MPLPDLSLESLFSGTIAGIDETGRGPWAGPVVAAAVILDCRQIPEGINDSKKVQAQQRAAIYDLLLNCAVTAVGMASVEEIDRYNILQATKLAMQRAVEALRIKPDIALVDGNRAPRLPCKVHTVIGGDSKSLSIAAASIVAKVTRDRIMRDIAQECPGYGFESNAGYGTKAHQKALKTLGVTPHHRRSFRPIRELLEPEADLFGNVA